jgi:hypothetical protein
MKHLRLVMAVLLLATMAVVPAFAEEKKAEAVAAAPAADAPKAEAAPAAPAAEAPKAEAPAAAPASK